DCMDGKIARLKGTGTPFGLWVDYVGDRVRVVCCAAGLASGQYAATGDPVYILLGAGVTVLDLFRYVNGPQMKRVREVVKESRAPQAGAGGPSPAEDAEPLDGTALPDGESWGDRLLGVYRRFGRFLGRYRVRPHLVSGIEFHAAVFVVAPLLGSGALLPVSIAAGALLVLNEVFLIYLLWLFTRTAAPAAPLREDTRRLPV
ncbi:CDP-alcohol phosphatidyltransferase family protein, partial [Planomonospora alba]|uniref:CDP-alcohol phosphatidyltransferase family protein n=1 Tax=Planomonospora alba TaxID=161354 RepID=UPI0031E80C84